ncbi:uncharacterized protein YjaZ [Cytobacillus eiseniae]|uniref:Uncharacterized protein YjaZ n=1 Tax=Cytobacillus eiseniae TaxID=762947 RepID=A0ABS4RH58_9BACI|nr:DUF2268 domain-containing putative Zn-dependent protease [Cytobacillus eiseniae]MBP2241766.1 uncharacterized protein YjaZ [Cytobacillus eiseniae]
MKKIILFIVIMLLASCSTDDAHSIPEDTNIKNVSIEKLTINNQEFEIIPTYSYYLDYIAEQQNSNISKNESFLNHVVTPVSNEIYGNSYSLNGNYHFATPRSISVLNEYISQLVEKHGDIIRFLEEGLTDSSDMLPGGNYKIFLTPYNPDESSLYMQGVAGFADEGLIVLQIDPNVFTGASLKETVAHEYHHTVYIEFSDYETRLHHLIDRVIMEGKADTFAKAVYPDHSPLWIEPLSPDTSKVVWAYIKENKYSYKYEDIINLFYGSVADGLPRWSNYKMGYHLMESFLSNNPDMSVEEWTFIPATEIIEGTEFSLK